MTDRRTLWIILIAAAALRLLIAARIPLVDDEAYYWTWSQRLAWGYPDHPPMIAALVRATTTIFGNNPLAVRLGPILLNVGIAWLLYDLGRAMFGPDVGILAALWFQTIPLFSIGGILTFPDAPFIFFWMLAMWALWRALAQGGLRWWILLGAAGGLAVQSKLAALFLGISVAGYLAWGQREHRWWRRPEPYLAAAVALAIVLPLLRWNVEHGGILLRKARDPYIWVSTGIPALNALAYAGAQLLYYGPLAALLVLIALAAAWRRPRGTDRRYVYAAWTAVPILGFFTAMSFNGIAKPHWTAPAYLVALLPAAALWLTVRHRQPWRRAVALAVAANLLLVGALATAALWPNTPAARELRAWPAFTAEVQRVLEATPASPGRFILVRDYQTAAQIEYHLAVAGSARPAHRSRARPDTVVKTPYGFDAYEVWIPQQRVMGWNAIYITAEEPAPGIPIQRMFRRVEVLPPISFSADATVYRTYAVYRGIGYQGLPR